MAYRRGSFSYVMDPYFKPYSFQDYLAPFIMYKDAYEKVDKELTELSKADLFKYLDQSLDPESKARSLYDNYAKDLHAQTEAFLRDGLSPGVRSGISALQKRYIGEIGMLEEADKRLKEAQKTRDARMAAGKSSWYATKQLGIDDFLFNKSPNNYSLDRDDVYARGVKRGAAISSRNAGHSEVDNLLGGLYAAIKETVGMPEEQIAQFMNSKPFNQMVDASMEALGYSNLDEKDQADARQTFIEGIYDGIVYKESLNVQRDLSKETAHEINERAFEKEKFDTEEARRAEEKKRQNQIDDLLYEKDANGNIVAYKPLPDDYTAAGYKRNPITGNIISPRAGGKTPEQKQIEKEEKDAEAEGKALNEALLKLTSADLKNDNAVTVATKNNRYTYKYIGGISNHGDYTNENDWVSGVIGEDNPGHNGLLGWGYGSSSNVEDRIGRFSSERATRNMRVLSEEEVENLPDYIIKHRDNLLTRNKIINESLVNEVAKNRGYKIDEKTGDYSPQDKLQVALDLARQGYGIATDVQIVAAQSEWPHTDENGYLIMVR